MKSLVEWNPSTRPLILLTKKSNLSKRTLELLTPDCQILLFTQLDYRQNFSYKICRMKGNTLR